MKLLIRFMLVSLIAIGISTTSHAGTTLNFNEFLNEYQTKSNRVLDAQQNLAQAERTQQSQTDYWQSRLSLNPELNFEERITESTPQIITPNRNQKFAATYTQTAPTGTTLELNGVEFIEQSNPLLSSLDSAYSAKLTQDLSRNAFGLTQRSQARKANTDYHVANMRFRQAEVNSCEEAFDLYANTYIQQEKWAVLQAQLKDAQKALSLARKLYKDRLIDKVDLLASENDFLETKVQANQAQQLLVNNKRQMMAFFKKDDIANMTLRNPKPFLGALPQNKGPTFAELVANERLKSQEFAVDEARSDRWTDVQLGLEAGQRKGRFGFSGVLTNFTEDYLYATLSVSFDVINRTEDGALKSAIDQRNSLTVQSKITEKTQKSVVDNLFESNTLLATLVQTSEKQVKMLNEKANIAFKQMKRGRLDFQNYLIHRNAYRNQQINTLNLKKDLWMNHFSLKKEYTQENGSFCKGES